MSCDLLKIQMSRTMLNFCSIVVAILKMETGRNCSMSGINSGRWNRTMLNLCSIVVAILKMATGRNCLMWCRELIPDIEKFLPVAIFKMATRIPHKFSIVRFQRHFICGQCWIFAVLWWPFWKWRPVEFFRCRESIQDVEIEQCWICAVLWWPFVSGRFGRLHNR
jgi:hypothetical protein